MLVSKSGCVRVKDGCSQVEDGCHRTEERPTADDGSDRKKLRGADCVSSGDTARIFEHTEAIRVWADMYGRHELELVKLRKRSV